MILLNKNTQYTLSLEKGTIVKLHFEYVSTYLTVFPTLRTSHPFTHRSSTAPVTVLHHTEHPSVQAVTQRRDRVADCICMLACAQGGSEAFPVQRD